MHGSFKFKCVYPDDLKALDPKNVITTGRRTRGIRVDYTKANTDGLDEDSDSETETKGPKKRKEAVIKPRTKSLERKQATNVEEVDEVDEDDEGGEDDGEEGQDDDPVDEDGDDDDDDD